MRRIVTIILAMALGQQVLAQKQRLTAEQVLAEMDSPTFVPTVKVGKVMYDGDSIQYMEMNNVYVYPQLTFKNKRQAESYMRLVKNVKKVKAWPEGNDEPWCIFTPSTNGSIVLPACSKTLIGRWLQNNSFETCMMTPPDSSHRA